MFTAYSGKRWIVAAVALCTFTYPLAASAVEGGRFKTLSVYLERNVQDHDTEVRFEVLTQEDGLSTLKVTAPGKRTVIDVRTPGSKLGLRGLTIESPEPTADGIVQADFPAGAYQFEGKTTKGAVLRGEARLSHVFPKPAGFEYPKPDQKDVPAASLTLRWSIPEEIESCVVVIEQTGSPYAIRALLPASAKAFTIPEGFLRSGQAYTFSIGTVAKDGNRTFVEAGFTTERAR